MGELNRFKGTNPPPPQNNQKIKKWEVNVKKWTQLRTCIYLLLLKVLKPSLGLGSVGGGRGVCWRFVGGNSGDGLRGLGLGEETGDG